MTKLILNTECEKDPALCSTDTEPTNEDLLEAEAVYEKATEKLNRAEKVAGGEPGLTTLDDFMRHALNHELLDPETERKLLTQIHEGILAEERTSKQNPNTISKEDQRLIQIGQDAMNELIEKNQRLVYAILSISSEGRYSTGRPRIMDYVQEGNIGLMLAARKFDMNRGVRFSTYATYWVRGMIKEAIGNNFCCLQIPSKVQAHMKAILLLLDSLGVDEARNITYEEISDRTGLSVDQVRRAMVALYRYVKDTSMLPKLRGSDYYAESGAWDGPMRYEKSCEEYENMLQSVYRSELREVLVNAVSALPDDERTALELRFRLREPESGRNMGYREIGERMGIQIHQARDLTKRALWDLKQSDRMRNICKAVDISTEEVLMKDARKFGELYTDYQVRHENVRIDSASAVDVFRKRYSGRMDLGGACIS